MGKVGFNQRRTGLRLAAYDVPVIKVALEAGEDVDYFGDSLDGCANHSRQHGAVVRAWYDAKIAVGVAEGPVVMGDKESRVLFATHHTRFPNPTPVAQVLQGLT